jgi:zinc/manganese transport system substrate-binding protein
MRQILTLGGGLGITLLAVTGCGGASDGNDRATSDVPSIVVTTNILGDVVGSAVGDAADVTVIMPLGADPHDFAPSARQAEAMENADLLVVNGAGFEAGMLDVIDAVDNGGTSTFTFSDHVELLDGEGADDPHLWTDPTRIADGLRALGDEIAAIEGIDDRRAREVVGEYVDELTTLDAQIGEILDPIPADDRVLVTNHEVLGYFADRYGFEVIGAVVPSMTTNAGASAQQLEALGDLISEQRVPAIFAETTGSTQLADALADQVDARVDGGIEIVELFTESLGAPGSGAETYLDMMRTNAMLIVAALATTAPGTP